MTLLTKLQDFLILMAKNCQSYTFAILQFSRLHCRVEILIQILLYNIFTFMSLSTTFNETTLSVIESYALSPNPTQFLQSLPQGMQKNILKALLLPYEPNLQTILIGVGVPAPVANQIVQSKIYQCVQSAKSITEIQQIVNDLKKTYLNQLNHSKSFQSRKKEVKKEASGSVNAALDRYPSKLNGQQFQDLQTYFLNILEKNQKKIETMSAFAIRNLPEQSLLNLTVEMKAKILGIPGLLPTFSPEFVSKFFQKYEHEMTEKQLIKYQIPQHNYRSLPTKHINKLAEDNPDLMLSCEFLKIWFSVNYEKRYPILTRNNSAISYSQKEQKRTLMKQIIVELQQVNKSIYRDYMMRQLEFQLLVLDLALEDPSIQRFVSYLSTVNENLILFNNKWSDSMKSRGLYNSRMLGNLQTNSLNCNRFGEEYVEAILRKYESTKYSEIDGKLLQIFDEKWYRKLKAKISLSKGEEDVEKVLNQNQKLEIRQKKELTICDSNKGSFRLDQDVVLKMKIKNISKIVVKIYELNLEKHYVQKKGQIQNDMDLHFLDPTYQFVYEVDNKNPFKEENYDMSLKEIKKERGVYIVDFDASGVSTRAVIRKGSIFCLTRVTLAGVQLKFYDEAGKVVEELNIWLRGQLVNVKGSYLIPFGLSRQNLEIIAVVGQYAEMLTVSIPSQSYTLTVTPYVNKQSLIVGSKAKILLNPRLYLNQEDSSNVQTPISLKLLKNININITVTDLENVKSVISFENVTWSYSEDFVVEIPIQTYLRFISLTGSAQITKYNGEKQFLTFDGNIPINYNCSQEIAECYLKKIGKDYIVFVLGLDGEPIPKMHVPVQIKNKWFSEFTPHDLQSDDRGEINLGPLQYVQAVFIEKYAKEWWIGSLPGTSQLFKKMCFREGEKIRIPLPPTHHKIEIGTDANLFSMEKQFSLENLNSLLKISDQFIEIPGLSTGRYSLSIFSLNYSGTIVVLKGVQWENPNQIYNQETATVYEFIRSSNHYLNLSEPKIEYDQQNGNKVTMDIIAPEGVEINDNVKVHIFAYSFIPTRTCSSSIVEVSKNDAKYSKFTPKGNSYLCNKRLSQEASYVLNRKQQSQFVGNNLQKPHILLKRIKVRDTVQKQEQMKQQQNFSQRRQNVVDLLDDGIDMFNFSQNTNNNNRGPQTGNMVPFNTQDISLHNNFLQVPGMTIDNVKTGRIQFSLPHCYSFFSVVLVSNNSQLIRNCSVEKSTLITKRLSHAGLSKETDQSTAWSISREVYPFAISQCRKISRTSKWCAISLSNIIRFAKAQNVQLDEWVEKWSSYTWSDKLQIYNKKACHELNSYIKHQDVQFFKKVVGPFIKNKINKTFVDLCLIEDNACLAWVPLHFFKQLNYFEKALLIEVLAKQGKFKEAQGLADAMELQDKVNKFNYASFKQKFESLLNVDATSVRPVIPNLPPPPSMQQNLPPPPPPPPQYRANTLNTLFGVSGTTSATTATCFSAPPPPPSMGYSSQSGTFGGQAPRSVPTAMFSMARAPVPVRQTEMIFEDRSAAINESNLIDRRGTYVQEFKQVQNTSEYSEVSYEGIKDPNSITTNFVPRSKFWSDLICHFARGRNNKNFEEQTFINESIMYLSGKLPFTLAASFLPKNLNPDYQIASEGSDLLLTANKPFLLLIKEIKSIPFIQKSGLIINHRFIDPSDMFTFEEDGSKIEKEVDEFIYGKQYCLQTLVTNISSNSLQIQLLVDLPQGSIPLETKEYTQITTASIPAYSTQSFSRKFYFPREGEFELYPANACWVKNVIARASNVPKIVVKSKKTTKKLETFMDVIEEGETQDIMSYLRTKNLFDENIFKPHEILWMLKDKEKFQKIVDILRERGFINVNIWMFGLLHENLEVIKQFVALIKARGPVSEELGKPLKVLEYYPYYSSRAHKYENINKAKIRNVEFKETYYRFLLDEIVNSGTKKKTSFILGAAYYLLLQDRVDEASKLIKSISLQNCPYKLQFDYMECFLDMYEGFPTFTKARKIVQLYKDYPISSWRVLFEQIDKTLRDYDSAVFTEEDEKRVQYRTVISKQDQILRISLPENQRVEVLLYSINLELLFSENPFQEAKECSSVRPAKVIVYEPGQSREQRLKRPEELKDLIVEIYESGKSTYLRKVQSFSWPNPKLKVKTNEKTGSLQVFYQNKPMPGTYCKVYSTGSKGVKFYRDGYTDITGSFKYALSELSQINRFSVLCMSDHGGRIVNVGKPTQAGELSQF